MVKILVLIGAIVATFGCATSNKQESSTSVIQGSKYKVGDFIEYRYSGAFRENPILLTEEVIAKTGTLLTILVHLKSSTEERKWKQIVTDSPENQRSNKVDRLIEVLSPTTEVELLNKGNSDLLRLYRGTYLTPDGPAINVTIDRIELSVCGQKVLAKRTRGQQSVNHKVYTFESYESDDFLWTNIGSQYTAGSEVFYKAEVTRCGR